MDGIKGLTLRPGMTVILPLESGGLDPFGLPVPSRFDLCAVQDVSGEPSSMILTVERIDHEDLSSSWKILEHGIETDTLEESVARVCAETNLNVAFSDPEIGADGTDQSKTPRSFRLWLHPGKPDLAEPSDATSVAACDRDLDEHLNLARIAAERITGQLSLDRDLCGAVIDAARFHDLGKAERRWQEAIGNFDAQRFLAKRKVALFDQRRNDGYRHELGSLVRASDISELTSHLIAAHHGWARPYFKEKAKRKNGCRKPSEDAVLRFGRLQSRYGVWGLAYLEALVRCADVQAEVLAEQLKEGSDVNQS